MKKEISIDHKYKIVLSIFGFNNNWIVHNRGKIRRIRHVFYIHFTHDVIINIFRYPYQESPTFRLSHFIKGAKIKYFRDSNAEIH